MKVLLFLLSIFLTGVILKIFIPEKTTGNTKFDYSAGDSLFINAGSNGTTTEKSGKGRDKNVDYKQEVLDFRKRDFSSAKQAGVLKNKSININKAGIKTLVKLPGIGPSTAQKIVNYRSQNGNFHELHELINVRGIGKLKFNKIKKYLYIEQ